MIFALKKHFFIKKLKILRPKVTEIFMNLHKKFCEYPPCILYSINKITLISYEKVTAANKITAQKYFFVYYKNNLTYSFDV